MDCTSAKKLNAELHKLSSVEDRGQADSVTILANRWFSIRGKLPDIYRCKKRLELNCLRSVGLKISMETKGRRDRHDRLQYSTFLPTRSTISHFGYNLPSNRRISLALTTKLSRREKIHNTYLLTCYTTVDSFKT